MKIIKYLLLLLLLTAVSFFVFILTQSGRYSIGKDFMVEADQSKIYNYLSNPKLWNDWLEIDTLNDKVQVNIDGFNFHTIKNQKLYPEDSIQQLLTGKEPAKVRWCLTPLEENKTKVYFHIDGRMDFKSKITSFWDGTPNEVIEHKIESDVANLICYFKTEYESYQLDNQELEVIPAIKYIYTTHTSAIVNIEDALYRNHMALKGFTSKNKIFHEDLPMLLVREVSRDSLVYHFGLPIVKSVFLNSNDPVRMDSIQMDLSLKSVLHGHYNHIPAALSEIDSIIRKGETQRDLDTPILIRFKQIDSNSKYPSQWVSVINTPMLPNLNESKSQSKSTDEFTEEVME